MREWAPVPCGLRVRLGELHVFRSRLDLSPQAADEATRLVSEDELVMAETLDRPGDGRDFLCARALTRRVLGWVLERHPAGIEFCRTEHGRLALADREVRFSVSYVEGELMVAVSRKSEVGVDIHDSEVTYDEDLHLALTEGEMRLLRRLSPSVRQMFFLGLWARKEAVLRAVGYGLRVPPDEVDVLLEDGQGTVAVPLPHGGGVVEVHVRDLPSGRGTVAAVAAAGAVTDLHSWTFTPHVGAALWSAG